MKEKYWWIVTDYKRLGEIATWFNLASRRGFRKEKVVHGKTGKSWIKSVV